MSTAYGPPPNPNQPQTVYIAVNQKAGLLSRLFSALMWLFVIFMAVVMIAAIFSPETLSDDPAHRVEERYHSLDKNGTLKVAIIEVDGTIMDAEQVRKQCEKAQLDEQVKAIVLRVDSPGGTVSASDEMYHCLKKLRESRKIPLVVSMGGLAASGGYYISMAVGDQPDAIYAEPTTWTGSIGVMIPHYTIAGLMDKLAVEDDTIKSAPLKTVGSITKKMTPEERAVLQTLVDESFDRFKSIVESGRPKLKGAKEKMDKATTGQIFTTKQAMELGLVDKEGFLEDAILAALEKAGLDAKTTKVVKYKKPSDFAEFLMGAQAPSRSSNDLQKLMNLATPRAYYLFGLPLGVE